MFDQDAEKDKKLDWMYKGPHSTVDREEYLLGRKVDKTLEQLNEEDKQKQQGLAAVPPKNKVEHECIPPSIRDFNKVVQAEQVDLSAKLQEDPLVVIKRREEETRRQFLQNPVQLKKLQKALKAQQLTKEKKKKHKSKKKSSKKSSSKEERNLDTILIHKYEEFKDKLTDKDLQDVFNGILTDTDSDSESNSSEASDADNRQQKKGKKRNSEDNADDRQAKKRRRDKKKESSGGESSDEYQKNRQMRKKYNNSKRNESRHHYRSDSDSEEKVQQRRKEYQDRKDARTHKDREQKSRRSRSRSPSRKNTPKTKKSEKAKHKKETKPSSSSSSSSSSSEESDSNSSDSDEQRRKKEKRNYGLVTSDGKKIKLSKKTETPLRKETKVVEPPKPVARKNKAKRLTEEEKDELRRKMMENAIERDRERVENVRRHRESDERESKQQDYDPNFVHKQLVKSANTSSVESRIKSNLNNIQRSGRDMDRHFSRRH